MIRTANVFEVEAAGFFFLLPNAHAVERFILMNVGCDDVIVSQILALPLGETFEGRNRIGTSFLVRRLPAT